MVRERRKRRHKSGSKKQRPLRSDAPSIITASIDDMGMTVRLHNDQIVIAEIEPHSLASKAGLRPGFVIEDIVGVDMKELRAGLSCS
jgi:C-terminal processing protease CtpA/Prc